ncbi:tetratricopeptide repeat protein, partial [candidate division KSB1 bacterium]
MNFTPQNDNAANRTSDNESSIYTTLNISRKGKLVIGVLSFQNNTNDESLNFIKQGISNGLSNFLSQARFMEVLSFDRGEFNRVVEQLDISLQLDPEYFESLILKSQVLTRLNKKNDAVQTAKEIIDLYPDQVQSYMNLGQIYRVIGKKDDAVDQFELAVEKAPDNFWPYLYIALEFFENKEYAKGAEFFEKTFDRIPQYSEDILYNVNKYLLDSYFQLGRFNRALELLTSIKDDGLFDDFPEYVIEIDLLLSEILVEFDDIKNAFQVFQNQTEDIIFSERSFVILGHIFSKTDDRDIIDNINVMADQFQTGIENRILNSYKLAKDSLWGDAINSFVSLFDETDDIRL